MAWLEIFEIGGTEQVRVRMLTSKRNDAGGLVLHEVACEKLSWRG